MRELSQPWPCDCGRQDTAALNQCWAYEIASALLQSGVQDFVLSPGSRHTPLSVALAECLDPIIVLDERTAGFVALGIAKVTGRTPLLLATSGTAAAHYLPAAIEARYSRTPMLICSADRPAELQNAGAPQTIDQSHIFDCCAVEKLLLPCPAWQLSPNWLRQRIAWATLRTQHPAPGPVHINLPFREPLWRTGLPQLPTLKRPQPPHLPPHKVLTYSRTLHQTLVPTQALDRGALLLGPRANQYSPNLNQAAHRFAKALGWVIFSEPLAGLRSDPCCCAAPDLVARQQRPELKPNLLVSIGQIPTSKALWQWLSDLPRIAIDPHGDWLDPDHQTLSLLQGDPATALEQLTELLPRAASTWHEQWSLVEQQARKHLTARGPETWDEPSLIQALITSLPEGSHLHVNSGMPVRDLTNFGWSLSESISLSANRGANGIDGGVATALGAALGTEQPCYLLTGDLGFAHDHSSLLAANNLLGKHSLCIIIVDNGGGQIFQHLPIAQHPHNFERLFLTPQQLHYEALAQAHNFHFYHATQKDSFKAALKAVAQSPGLHLIQATVEARSSFEHRREAFQSF